MNKGYRHPSGLCRAALSCITPEGVTADQNTAQTPQTLGRGQVRAHPTAPTHRGQREHCLVKDESFRPGIEQLRKEKASLRAGYRYRAWSSRQEGWNDGEDAAKGVARGKQAEGGQAH